MAVGRKEEVMRVCMASAAFTKLSEYLATACGKPLAKFCDKMLL